MFSIELQNNIRLVKVLNNNFVKKNINIQQTLFFSFLKNPGLKNKTKTFNVNYLIIALIKMKLLIFLVFSQYGLARKHRIILQVSIYNWTQNCIF